MTENLATFDHRHAMRHVRTYPHPIERVFEAVSTAEHLDAWMLPHCRIERRKGGAWAMTFGGPDLEQAITGTIVAWDPPRLVDYGGMRFELERVGEGETRLTFTHTFAPGFEHPPSDQPGADLPGGPGTPWRPGFVAGFHLMFDDLGPYLAGTLQRADLIDNAAPGHHGIHEPQWLDLLEVYRRHIRDTIPAA
jgi:uncharacterized protein YndB with AHSA1/START domain